MSDTIADLRRKIESAGNLQSVVRTMKALAAHLAYLMKFRDVK